MSRIHRKYFLEVVEAHMIGKIELSDIQALIADLSVYTEAKVQEEMSEQL